MIQGLVHEPVEFKIALYVDGLLLCISRPEISILGLIKIIDNLGRILGYTIR